VESLWEDENFTVRAGIIQPLETVAGADLGPGILYYPAFVSLLHRVGGEASTGSQLSRETNFFWSTGALSEIINSTESAAPFVLVALKPSHEVKAELPEELFGLSSAVLLQDDWAEEFKEAVREDLETIWEFVEALRTGVELPEEREDAILAKEDLDLKLLWSAQEFSRRGLLNLNYMYFGLTSPVPSSGLINVTANTKDQTTSAAVPNCVVWYVKRIKRKKPAAYKRFSTFSTPTSEHLAVGNYEMWAEKSGVQGRKDPISVVSTSTSQSIDLFAP
jgi:hypothetical protein